MTENESTRPSHYAVRPAHQADIAQLGAVEKSVGTLFRTAVGLDSLANNDPLPLEVLKSYLEIGNLWVVSMVGAVENMNSGGEIVAFLAVFPIVRSKVEDGVFLHIAELSVHSAHQRRGLARRLLHHLESQARAPARNGTVIGLSLTTYRHLAFNGQFYTSFGFTEIPRRSIEEVVGPRGQ